MNKFKWLLIPGIIIGCLFVSISVFHTVCQPETVLLTSDDNIGQNVAAKRLVPRGFFSWWDDAFFWGHQGISVIRPVYVLLWALPAAIYQNWVHAIALSIASFFIILYLRDQRCSWSACILGALVAFWTGNNLTLTYAGHTNKFAAMAFASGAIYFFNKASLDQRWEWRILAGIFIGFMFFEQADVAAFSGIFLASFFLYRTVCATGGWNIKRLGIFILPVVLVAGTMIGGALLPYMKVAVQGVSVMNESSQERYEYLTQWSWPPEESVDFVAPGYTGWRSGEATGPYWGRMGRTAGWELTRQGFMNFKLENHYMGAVPVLLAILAFGSAGVRRYRTKSRSSNVSDTLFWGAVCITALIFAFGKYTPLYHIIASLPGFSGMRNPNKFLHIFQIALGICAAFGWDAVIKKEANVRIYRLVFLLGAGVFLFAGLILLLDERNLVSDLMRFGWPKSYADIIYQNKTKSLFYAGGMFFLGAIICMGIRYRRAQKILYFFPALLILLETVFLLAPRYIQAMPLSDLSGNMVTDILKDEMDDTRMAFLPQDEISSHWLTYLFPYHGIHSINATQVPRMPDDYGQFFNEMGRNPVRLWELAAVSHVIVSADVFRQMERNPMWQKKFENILNFDVISQSPGAYSVQVTESGGKYHLLRLHQFQERVSLVFQAERLDDKKTLQRLAELSFPWETTVIISSEIQTELYGSENISPTQNYFEKIEIQPGAFEITVNSPEPAIVRFSEHYNSDWKAMVNGKNVPVWRINYLFMGIPVDAGEQHIYLRYSPSPIPFVLQMAWLPALLAAGISFCTQKKRSE